MVKRQGKHCSKNRSKTIAESVLMRIALGIEYNGHGFYGWQAQRHDNLPTIQGALEAALARVANEDIFTLCRAYRC